MYHQESLNVLDSLSEIRDDLVGGTTFTLGEVAVDIKGKDSVGNLVQEWLGEWFRVNGYPIIPGPESQSYPDFYICDDEQLLEVKTFNAKRSPAFDIANFEAYCASLALNPERLFSDYLIFSYRMTEHSIRIEDIWLKKIWEITGASNDFDLKCQVKYRHRNTPAQTYSIDNIRPIVWYSNRRDVFPPFSDHMEFVEALYSTQQAYRGHSDFEVFEENYNLLYLDVRD